ncbi:translation initiation factor IF-2, partial [archaeon]|nr:translation initiation factor IF-2 [archaeon]
MKTIRSLICLLTGHVDHGKSQIVEVISNANIIEKEPGKITQKISAINVPFSQIQKISGNLLQNLKLNVNLPGFLLIDSPGHASFTSLRKRGGNIADMAVLVVDLNEGLKPQTLEAIEILKQYKTPFIIAANKIDLIPGWQKKSDLLVSSLNQQAESTINALNHKLYELVGKLYELGINAERFDKVTDYTKQVAIVPISAKTNQGIPELVMVLMGLSQKFLEKELEFCKDKPGKAVVLEVREKKGLGCVLDLILYDGLIKKNDQIIIAGIDEPIVTKVKCIFEDDKEVKESCAASSVTLVASDLKGVVSGMPVEVIKDNLSELKVEIQKQVEEVFIETDEDGVVIKADSVGSLEAVIKLLKENKIKIKYANIGKINKKDIATACSSENKIDKVILGF